MASAFVDTVFFDLGDTLVTSNPPAWLTGAKELLESLKRSGVRLGVISNTGQLTRAELSTRLPSGFDWSLFESDLILLSSETGYPKPAPEAFQLALTRAGSHANCLFCTEDLLDTLVAQQVGMKVLRVERPPNSDIRSAAVALRTAGLVSSGMPTHLAKGTATSSTSPPEDQSDTKILQLMSIPPIHHDLAWLKESLQAAVSLELSTIPPYLCAWWSIQDDGHPAAAAIREIVIEEMLHLGLVCNLMTTLGETPRIASNDVVPQYPGHLPGGVRPSVRIALSGLTRDVLSGTFMEIEFPESGPIASVAGETFPTIGSFYNAIAAAFAQLPPGSIVNQRQLKSNGLGLFPITSLADAQTAIALIERQGEGTSQSPQAGESGEELAHYYRFAEIWHERRLQQDAAGQWRFDGDVLPFPAVYPMAEVPAGGYPESLEFDQQYTAVLQLLQAAWETGSQSRLGQAVSAMFGLTAPARALMQRPLPSGSGTFGPSFRLILTDNQRSFTSTAGLTTAVNVPQPVIAMMAQRTHRMQHYLWHEVRNNWLFYDEPTRGAIRALGWEPPRPAQRPTAGGGRTIILDNNSGEDFLYMHRRMIGMVNQQLAQLGDPTYPRVTGWPQLPEPTDSAYPVPPAWDTGDPDLNQYLRETKSDSFFRNTLQSWERDFTDPAWLRGRSLGEVGSRIEFTIHNRMHMRWCSQISAVRPDSDPTHPDDIDTLWDAPSYNWLGDTYSSHVHSTFWKIHGWVDARIEDWKRANGITGDIPWTGTWVGPESLFNLSATLTAAHDHSHPGHMSNLRKLLRIVQFSGFRSRFYDPVSVPDSEPIGVSHFPVSTAKVQQMAKKPLAHENPAAADELASAIQNLTQVADSLATSADQMMRAVQMLVHQSQPVCGDNSSSPAAGTTINVWEDDPFSEASPTSTPSLAATIQVPVPTNMQSLKFRILDSAVAAGQYHPGTREFRYWEATEAITRGINFWNPKLPAGTVWSSNQSPLQVQLVAGQDFNANYSRRFGLRFYQGSIGGQQFFSAESPDVVCHELGHGILDAIRPELFNSASAETAAFHESFGDMSAILNALQLESLRAKVLQETNGRLNVNSRLSRLAEQLGWAIRQLSPTAVDTDSLRNAANRFFYVDPDTLPPSAPSSVLSSEAHSFSRVFSGAFLDALARMLTGTGSVSQHTLQRVSEDMGRLLVEGVRLAPITPNYFSQVAAAMVQVNATLFQDRYRSALLSGFIQHGILSPTSSLTESIPTPRNVQMTGVDPLLALGVTTTSYRDSGLNAPDLPTQTIEVMGLTFDVHAPEEEPRFSVASAAFSDSSEMPDSHSEASSYVQGLIQNGYVDLSTAMPEMRSFASDFQNPADDNHRVSNKHTHAMVAGPNGRLVLKRLHFNCGCGSCRHHA